MTFIPCNTTNYRQGRTGGIKYIVLHYTANNGDTAKNNCDYYKNNANLSASAHYFVDENGIMQSVKDENTAWHCGGSVYFHKECRNYNSIGIEMCSRKDSSGNYYLKAETVTNAVELTKQLMAKYSVDIDHVIRHYDVSGTKYGGKHCPEPWVRNPDEWTAFKARLIETKTEETEEEDEMTRYHKVSEMPDWAKADIQKLIDGGYLAGGSDGDLNLSEDMMRVLIIIQRMITK